jgi:hypothetical protein
MMVRMCVSLSLYLLPLVLATAAAVTSRSSPDLSDMPVSICGWPSLHTTGKFPEWNTRLAQYLLGFVLEEEIPVDGVFTDTTTDEISRFQAQSGLEVNGYLNSDTWPSLVGEVSPLLFGATGRPVEALQDTLSVNGYSVEISGEYDAATQEALSRFQSDRGASVTTGQQADDQTWHLLTTQCNSSLPGHYWFDAGMRWCMFAVTVMFICATLYYIFFVVFCFFIGWPQGNISTATFECLKEHSFEYAVIECWREKDGGSFWTECVDNVANARAAGFSSVDVYMYFERYRDPAAQASELLNNLTLHAVQYRAVMLDVEGDKWTEFSPEDNQAFMLSLRHVFDAAGTPLVMYAGSMWDTYFGTNFTAFKDLPLVYAHYDNIPSFYDWDYAPYGGWERASGKQFFDGIDPEVVCGLPLDWDWSPSVFWK